MSEVPLQCGEMRSSRSNLLDDLCLSQTVLAMKALPFCTVAIFSRDPISVSSVF